VKNAGEATGGGAKALWGSVVGREKAFRAKEMFEVGITPWVWKLPRQEKKIDDQSNTGEELN